MSFGVNDVLTSCVKEVSSACVSDVVSATVNKEASVHIASVGSAILVTVCNLATYAEHSYQVGIFARDPTLRQALSGPAGLQDSGGFVSCAKGS